MVKVIEAYENSMTLGQFIVRKEHTTEENKASIIRAMHESGYKPTGVITYTECNAIIDLT